MLIDVVLEVISQYLLTSLSCFSFLSRRALSDWFLGNPSSSYALYGMTQACVSDKIRHLKIDRLGRMNLKRKHFMTRA